MPLDAGVIANCACCDSYFMVVAHKYDLKAYKGKKGTAQMENEIEELQVLIWGLCLRVLLLPVTDSPSPLHSPVASRKESTPGPLLPLLQSTGHRTDVGGH
jgi:hypothetical protein